MNNRIFLIMIAGAIFCVVTSNRANADQASQFNETTISSVQSTRSPSSAFTTAMQAFDASNDPAVKESKWEDALNAESEGLLSATWTAPSGGWKLITFPATGNLRLQDVVDQPSQTASYTKLVAQNETEAVQLRGAGAMMLTAASDGEQWANKLILDIAQGPDNNLKRVTYWFAKNFAQDVSKGNGVAA